MRAASHVLFTLFGVLSSADQEVLGLYQPLEARLSGHAQDAVDESSQQHQLPFEYSSQAEPCVSKMSGQQIVGIEGEWEVLGPFQIGTREAAWGADPLEYHGGFGKLLFNVDDRYPSSYGFNGTVSWSKQLANEVSSDGNGTSIVDLDFQFPHIDWDSLRSIYGWAATQFQAWARGWIQVEANATQTIELFSDGILEFCIGDQRYFGGDFYSLRNAPLIAKLAPGKHRFDIRVVRDVRSMGGFGEPNLQTRLEARVVREPGVRIKSSILPDFLKSAGFAGQLGSITIENSADVPMKITGLVSTQDDITIRPLNDLNGMAILPGQTRPLAFRLSGPVSGAFSDDRTALGIQLSWVADKTSRPGGVVDAAPEMRGSHLPTTGTLLESISFQVCSPFETHKYTYQHSSGIVSYAMLRPPPEQTWASEPLPVLLNLHGAGLEVDSHEVRRLFDPISDLAAWIVSPSGVTTWSGDDWHTWGFADVESALRGLKQWFGGTHWHGPSAITSRYYVCGHSNGGQGTWYTLTHRPGNVISAATVSGYSSIESYVPYQFWSVAEPAIAAVLSTARVSYKHELLAPNFAGIPLFQQHGGADDNVPVYHSRHMYQQARQSGSRPKFLELPGKGHWYDGVMMTAHLKEFYDSIRHSNHEHESELTNFILVTTHSGDVGARGGLQIDQLHSPRQLGKVVAELKQDIEGNPHWVLETSNVRRFHIKMDSVVLSMTGFEVDEQTFSSTHAQTMMMQTGNEWQADVSGSEWRSFSERSGRQLGGIDALLRSNGPIGIQGDEGVPESLPLQVSRNLFQYFRADTIVANVREPREEEGNIVRLCLGPLDSCFPDFDGSTFRHPFRLEPSGLTLELRTGQRMSYRYQPSLGAIFLTPRRNESVEVVVWGFDLTGLEQAARLLPTTAGVGQPDFVVLSRECKWRGSSGVLATGFFDSQWQISDGSFLS